MPQTSLIRSPAVAGAPAARAKHRKWTPWWIVRGGGPRPAPASPPTILTQPVANTTGLSVAGAGVLSVTSGTWTHMPTAYAYQWARNGVIIVGATAATKALVAADIGSYMACRVTATNPVGASIPVVSNWVGPIVA
jgi:hypothetical protein